MRLRFVRGDSVSYCVNELPRRKPSRMTIRRLVYATMAVAILLAVALWNWGIPLLVAVIWGLRSMVATVGYPSRPRLVRRFIDLIVFLAIYFLSIGPVVGLSDAIYGFKSIPGWLDSSSRFVYAPHAYLMSGDWNQPSSSVIPRAIHDFLNGYVGQWRDFGLSIHSFTRAVFDLG